MNKRVDGLNFIRIIGMTLILLFHAKLMYGFSIGNPWLDGMISIGAIFIIANSCASFPIPCGGFF